MMNSFQRNIKFAKNPAQSRVLVFVTVVVVCAAVVDVVSGGTLRNIARASIAPVSRAMHAASATLMGDDFWSSRAALISEIEALESQVSVLAARGASFDAVVEENKSLRDMALLAAVEGGVTAPVISSFYASPYGTFHIGAGSDAGVAAGDLALAEGGYVLGEITDVARKTSTARTVFAPGMSVDVVIGSVGFRVEGRGGGNGRAEVPREALLVGGEVVVAPSFGGRPIAIIGKVASTSASALSDVYVVFPVNLSSIRFVHIVPGVL
jgi:cell shape-determining protein MreC